MREKLLNAGLMVVLLVASRPGLSQAAQQNRTLIVSGHSGQAQVLQLNGRSYVDTEALARLTNGSLSFNGNQIALTLPASTSATAPPEIQPALEFSKEFMQ